MSVERHKFDAWPGQEVRDLETDFITRRVGGQWRGFAVRQSREIGSLPPHRQPGDSFRFFALLSRA